MCLSVARTSLARVPPRVHDKSVYIGGWRVGVVVAHGDAETLLEVM